MSFRWGGNRAEGFLGAKMDFDPAGKGPGPVPEFRSSSWGILLGRLGGLKWGGGSFLILAPESGSKNGPGLRARETGFSTSKPNLAGLGKSCG